jgi:protein-S-isoprenylcysteine O-methyltransferase Ste14
MTTQSLAPLAYSCVGILWAAFGILWLIAAAFSKKSVQVQTGGSRLLQSSLLICGVAIMFNWHGWISNGWMLTRLIPNAPPALIGGPLLVLAGMGFCVWARVILGTNWSSAVTIKQDHQLILRGPYQVVRHPIYTGLLMAFLGTAFTYGITRCFVAVPICGLALWLKSQTEEQFMVQQFGAQYIGYRQHVRALIPFVL